MAKQNTFWERNYKQNSFQNFQIEMFGKYLLLKKKETDISFANHPMIVFHNLPMVHLSQVFSVDFSKNRGYDVARVTEIFSKRCLLVWARFLFSKKNQEDGSGRFTDLPICTYMDYD